MSDLKKAIKLGMIKEIAGIYVMTCRKCSSTTVLRFARIPLKCKDCKMDPMELPKTRGRPKK